MTAEEESDAFTENVSTEENGNIKLNEEVKTCPASTSPRISMKARLADQNFRRKLLKTLCIGASFWVLGFAISQRGAAVLDLQIITRTNLEEGSMFFTSSCVGYLLGSLVAGVVYDKLNKSVLLLLCVAGMALASLTTPWCSIYGLMIAIHFIFSLFGGGNETVGNAEALRIWGKDGEMAMQFIHFAYAFGGVVGPLATAPFLTPVPEDDEQNSTVNAHFENMTSLMNASHPVGNSDINSTYFIVNWNVSQNSSSETLFESTDVHYAYMITGTIMLLVSLAHTVQVCTERSEKRHTPNDKKPPIKQPLPLVQFLFVLFFLCVFSFLSVSIEDTIASYLPAFVVKQLHWSKLWGAQITSLYWASFATCRFLSIFAVRALTSVRLLIVSCATLALSKLAFLFFSYYHITVGVWISVAFIGSSLAPIFPSCFSWMEEELVRVTGMVSSSITISASAGSLSSPVILGFLMQQLTPMWYAYLMFGEAALCLAVFVFLLAFSRCYVRKHFTMSRGTEQEEVITSPDEAESMVVNSSV